MFIIRNFCQENGRTHLALYFENEGIFISKISQIGSIPCQVYLMEIVYPCGINVFIIKNQLLFFALLQTSYRRTIALRALKVSYSDVVEGGVAVNYEKTQFFLNTLYII